MPADMTVTATSGVNPALTTTVSTPAGQPFVVVVTATTKECRRCHDDHKRQAAGTTATGARRPAVANLLHRGLVAT
jgi:hypothetical protein